MDSQIITIDCSFGIQKKMRSCSIEFCDRTEFLQSASHIKLSPTVSGSVVIMAVSAFKSQSFDSLIHRVSASSHLTVLVDESTAEVSHHHVPQEYVEFCLLEEISQRTVAQFLTIARNLQLIEQLRHEKHCYRAMVDSCPDYVFVRDSSSRIVAANSKIADLHDLESDQMIGKTYLELTGDVEGHSVALTQDSEILDTGKSYYQNEDFYQDESGNEQWNRVTKKRIPNHNGTDYFVLGVATNLTEWKKNELKLIDSENRFRKLYRREQLLRHITDAITTTDDTEAMLRLVGDQLVALFESSTGGVIDHLEQSAPLVSVNGKPTNLLTILTTTLAKDQAAPIYHTLDGGSLIASVVRLDDDNRYTFYLKNGKEKSLFTVEDSALLRSIANQCFVSITRNELNEKIEYQAFHDSLTGLPNRWNYERVLQQRLNHSVGDHERFGVLFLDLDGFKVINDTYGHLVGDEVLREASKRLSGVVGTKGFLARMGGDEFSIVVNNVLNNKQVEQYCHKLLEVLNNTICIGSHRFSVDASIGVALCPRDGTDPTELMRKADSAMYHAKASRNLSVGFFNKEIELKEQRRLLIENDLLIAIEEDSLELHYQPQYDLQNADIVGVEALARWNHPKLGFISPDEFIGVAEQSSLILTLGDWVTQTALKQAKLWEDQGYRLKMAINFSPTQCEQIDFSQTLMKLMDSSKIDQTLVQIEITESTLMKDRESLSRQLHTLRDHGLSIAIDDFGTGYSSLGYLQHLPLDVLKIDRSFVDLMDVADPAGSLIGVITRMAKDLGLSTVAEGVETAEQLAAITVLGCDQAQGWYFAKAMPASELTQLLCQTGNAENKAHGKAA